ncbi:protein of unknown function [Aminobacter niigataensis]|nr:protein of unknown function [Aminobacter niigataensis]
MHPASGVMHSLSQDVVIGGIPDLREAAVVEHAGDGLAYLEHHVPDLAGRLVAVVARLVLGAAGAWDRRQGPVEHAHDMADLDLRRRLGEPVAAVLALAALDEAGIAQLAQDGVEELFRDFVGSGDVADEGELACGELGQMDEGLEPVFAFFSQHGERVSSASAACRSMRLHAEDNDSSPSHSGSPQR